MEMDEARWALHNLNAREAVDLLKQPEVSCRSLLLEFLLVDGVYSILLESLQVLTVEERAHVMSVIEKRGLLTKGQRAAIRDSVRNLGGT